MYRLSTWSQSRWGYIGYNTAIERGLCYKPHKQYVCNPTTHIQNHIVLLHNTNNHDPMIVNTHKRLYYIYITHTHTHTHTHNTHKVKSSAILKVNGSD